MGYSAADQLQSYAPPEPVAGTVLPPEQRDYTLHRKLEQWTRADGTTVDLSYRTDGKLDTRATSRGTLTYGYHPSSGKLQSIAGTGAVGVTYAYDGSFMTSETWTGSVTGSVSYGYDDDFELVALSVNGSPIASFEHDDDGLLTTAGPLTLTRDAASGDVTGTLLGALSTLETVSAFGELDDYAASHGSTELYREQVTSATVVAGWSSGWRRCRALRAPIAMATTATGASRRSSATRSSSRPTPTTPTAIGSRWIGWAWSRRAATTARIG
jgi:hypothetical protein